jgi:transcriptional regulator of acetoin/glycerol metabolism
LQNVIRVSVALLDHDETEVQPLHLPEELFGTDPGDDYEEKRHPSQLAESQPPASSLHAEGVAGAGGRSLDQIERDAIALVMREVGGNLSAAARRLNVSRNTLYRKLARMV